MSLGTTVNKEKNGVLLAYIANSVPDIGLRKLLKIVYLIDERFVLLRGFPLTWFNYYAWAKGPVAPEVYELKNGAYSNFVVCTKNENGKNIINSRLNNYEIIKSSEIFSPYELGVVDEVIYQCQDKTADELSDLTHRQGSLWFKVVKENNLSFERKKQSDVAIPLTMLIEDDDDKLETYNEALEYMRVCNA